MSRDEQPPPPTEGDTPPARRPGRLALHRMSAAARSLRRRPGARTSVWLLLALLVPLVARAHLARRVDTELEPALAAALEVPVEIGSLDATLTGLVRLNEVSAGSAISAASIEAAFDPFAIAAGDLEPAEIRVASPHVRLAGDPLWARLRRRLTARHGAGAGSPWPSRLRHLVVTGGVLALDLPGGLAIRASGVELQPRPGGARVVAGPVELTWRSHPAWTAEVRFARAAADIGAGPAAWRALAVGGRVQVGNPGQRPLVVSDATLSGGIRGRPGDLHLSGQVAGSDPGKVDLSLSLDSSGHVRRARVAARSLPLAFLAPLVRSWALPEAGRASGVLELAREGDDVAATAALSLDGVLIAHPFVSSEPVAVDGTLSGRGRLRRVAARTMLALDQLRLERAAVAVEAHGLFEWAGSPPGASIPERAQLAVTMPETPCDQVLAAVPPGMRGRLAGFDVDGTLAGSLALAFDRSDPGETALDLAMDLDRCHVVAEPPLADPLRLTRPFDLRLPDGSSVRVGDGGDHVSLSRLPRHVIGAFVAAEDARFFQHDGFDADQIERSLGIDLDSGRLLRGGSTISQQLVKNVFLGPERTVARKLQEAVITWRVEKRVDKRAILERYLDVIELGADIHGVGAAARYWFATSPEKLGVRQAAFLAALTPAPRTLSRAVHERGGVDGDLADRVDVVLRAMRVSRVIDRATFERARNEPLHLAPAALGRR